MIVKQRTHNDCCICSVSSVTGIDYDDVPRWHRRYKPLNAFKRIQNQLRSKGFNIERATQKPKNGIAVYVFYFKDDIFSHARPIIKGREYEVNSDIMAVKNLKKSVDKWEVIYSEITKWPNDQSKNSAK